MNAKGSAKMVSTILVVVIFALIVLYMLAYSLQYEVTPRSFLDSRKVVVFGTNERFVINASANFKKEGMEVITVTKFEDANLFMKGQTVEFHCFDSPTGVQSIWRSERFTGRPGINCSFGGVVFVGFTTLSGQ